MERKVFAKLDDIKLGGKFLILFFVCVVIPMITTNGYIIWSLKAGIDKEQNQRIENMAQRLEFELEGEVAKQISIADYLDRNVNLQEFLETKYEDASAYYEAYVELMENQVIQYYYTAQSTYSIVICTDNETITNGTYFVRRESVENSSWYREFVNSGRNIFLYSYFEDGKESSGYIERGRRIVLIQKLPHCGKDNLIMLEMDYNSLLESMEMVCEGVDGYLCIEDKILLSTRDKNSKYKEFWNLSELWDKGCSLEKSMELYGQQINMFLTAERLGVFSMIKRQTTSIFLLYLANLILPSLFVYILYRSLHDRIELTQEYLERMEKGVYEVIPFEKGKDEISGMIHRYNLMALRIKELVEVVFKNKEREQGLEIAKREAELKALQSQLNPHFVFNALESIRMHSILKQETETARILESFAILMRKNIQWNKDFVTIEDECDNVRRYLEIQKYRFGDRLEFYLHLQEECKQRLIPKFVIITFVENASVHGIEKSVEGGSVTVVVSEDEKDLYIEIMDEGSGMEQEELNDLSSLVEQADIEYIQKAEKSIGIVNTVVRMHQYYGEQVQIDINSTAQEGTEVCIRFPKNYGEDDFEKAGGRG